MTDLPYNLPYFAAAPWLSAALVYIIGTASDFVIAMWAVNTYAFSGLAFAKFLTWCERVND